ncbi:hypothetical protein AAC387_Pa11g0071 [Persea americana]
MKLHGLILFVIFAASAAAITASFKEDIKNGKLMPNENEFTSVDSRRLENLNSVRINGAGDSDGASGVDAGADRSKDSTGTDENDGRNGSRGSTADSHHSTDLRHWPPGTN